MFRIHLGNTRALDVAFETTARACRTAIGQEDHSTVDALTKTCAFLFGARMENRLFRLLFEPGGYSDAQRERILQAKSIEDSWVRAVSEAFAERYSLRPSSVPDRLSFTNRARHDELVRLVRDELAPVITLRNVLGHGQWHRALAPDRSRIDESRMRLLTATRLWHLTVKANVLDHLVWILHDLAVTDSAFERDFDKRWADLESAKHRLSLNKYQEWEAQLVRSYAGRPARSGGAS